MTVLRADHVTKRFFDVTVVKDVSLCLGKGEVLGLVGENGAGKSTLMSILGGLHQPSGGEMALFDEPYAPERSADAIRAGVALIHQELNLFPNLTVAENVFIDGFPRTRTGALDRRRMHRLAGEYLARVGLAVDPDTPLERLAPGEQQLVEIAKAVGRDAHVIIFDEPTTSLTNRETETLFALIEKLKADGIAIIYISHILEDVLRLADRVQVMRDGSSVAVMDRAQTDVADIVTRMIGRKLEAVFPDRSPAPPGERVLEVSGLGRPGRFEDVDFSVREGEIVGMFGLMGAGRTEVARAVFGLDRYSAGTVSVAERERHLAGPEEAVRAGLAFVTENRREEGLMMDMSPGRNMSLVALPRYAGGLGRLDFRALRERVSAFMQNLSVRAASAFGQPVRSLSGGNQQKVVLAKWLMTDPRLLILDEPTRGVDVGARSEIYRIIAELAEQGRGVWVISSELEELMGLCDRILVMCRGRLVADLPRVRFDTGPLLMAAFGEVE